MPRESVKALLGHVSQEILADPATYHAAFRKAAYRTFSIPKRDGGQRTIHAPTENLKAAQQKLWECIRLKCAEFTPSDPLTFTQADHGFVPGRGVTSALGELQPTKAVIQADLAAAFHQVKRADVLALLEGVDRKLARWIAHGTTRQLAPGQPAVLVMGSPLAPWLLAVATKRLRQRTEQLARVFQGKAVWYADNLVLSVPSRHRHRAKRELSRLLEGQRWTVKAEPEFNQKILGWKWRGITDPAPGWGWTWSRRERRRTRGLIRRANAHQDTKTVQRAYGTRQYALGPGRNTSRTTTFAASIVLPELVSVRVQ